MERREAYDAETGELRAAEAEDAREEQAQGDGQDRVERLLRGRGRPGNVSFFAFTATPKAKTLELFGTRQGAAGDERYAPTHLYSMCQAIEEGFILDVLQNYTTYQRYYRIERAIEEDPDYDPARAKRAIARFVDLHPHNLAQKAEVIVEHFREHVRHRIGGKAKAMVVTSSRLHAVRYKLAIDRYIKQKGYTDVAALVAFSGEVVDEGDRFTEARMNRLPESETAWALASDEYQVLIVAEKFQTGFDQPLLHTMYVDKVLTGLNAVQTLSRLNRTHPDKTDTFVLDFRNTAEEIQEAFRPWYETMVAAPTDPNLMYDTRQALQGYGIIRPEEVEALSQGLRAPRGSAAHAAAYAALDPAVERFNALDEDTQTEFRDRLVRFVNVYAFLAHVVTFTDAELEKFWTYSKALEACLPGQGAERLDLGKEVQLSHLRLERTFSGSASLDEGGGELRAIFDGRGAQHEPEAAPLSEIIDIINERFGLNLGDADRLLLDQYRAEMVADTELASQARANDIEHFQLVFAPKFLGHIVSRMDANDAIFRRILDDEAFRSLLFDAYSRDVYAALREGAA